MKILVHTVIVDAALLTRMKWESALIVNINWPFASCMFHLNLC